MVRVRSLVTFCSVAGLAAAFALAQPADKKAPPAPAKPADPPKAPAAPPEGMPDMKAMMDAWEASAKPGKMHERLQATVGVWDGKVKHWMDPGAPPIEDVATTTITSMFGGRFTKGETKGNLDMGPMGKHSFEGFGLYGYNNTTEKFECVWADNLGTMIMNFTGELSADGKTLTWTSKFTDPMSKQDTWMKNVEKVTGPDTMTMEMFGPGMDGKDMKMMEIHYTRKPGTAPAKDATKPAPAKPSTEK